MLSSIWESSDDSLTVFLLNGFEYFIYPENFENFEVSFKNNFLQIWTIKLYIAKSMNLEVWSNFCVSVRETL